MDFHTLLYKAQKNNVREKEVKYFKASLDPPKKETKESRQLSDSIKKFLAKKDEEDKQKQLEEQKKKDELLSLRSQDRKSFKRVQSMLNRTKSANKSVIEDAKDDVNTSVTMAGFHQPDEDDYGYASKDAMDIYNKIMDKYVNTPADSRSVKTAHHRSSDISGTKDRVRAALLKEEEDQLLPHKRKRKPKEVENNESHFSDVEEPQQKKSKTDLNGEKNKRRPAQPPPLNFQELLKIAEKKQFEPIIIEKPKKEENGPMMTKKERAKYLEEKRIEEMRVARRQGKCLPPIEKPKEIKPIEKPRKPIASSTKVDINAEDKLKKNSSVWAKDLKMSTELNNNGKYDKHVPRHMNGSESSGIKSNSTGNRSISNSSSERYSSNDKRYNLNDERYSPKPKSVNDKYTPKAKNPVEDKYSPKPKSISSNDRYVPKISSSSSEKYPPTNGKYIPRAKNSVEEKYSPKPTSSSNNDRYVPKSTSSSSDKYSPVNSKYIPRVKNSVEDKYSPKPKSLANNDRYVPKSSSSSHEKYSPKPTSSMLSDKYLPKSTSSERYVPKPKISSNEKYSPKTSSSVQHEKYEPKGKGSSTTERYTPSAIKRPEEKYSPKPVSSQSMKLKPTNVKERYVPTPVKSKLPPSNSNMKPKQFPPKDLVPKQFPPRDMMPKQFPPRDLVPKQFPPPDMRRRDDRRMNMRNKRQVIESDSDEYDSELDDFIDDGPEDEEDYSKVISEIFRYDKSKYREIDDDDECMESDYRTLQKEEYRSTRAGLLEDLADIRREKAMMKRQKKH